MRRATSDSPSSSLGAGCLDIPFYRTTALPARHKAPSTIQRVRFAVGGSANTTTISRKPARKERSTHSEPSWLDWYAACLQPSQVTVVAKRFWVVTLRSSLQFVVLVNDAGKQPLGLALP